MEQVIIYGAGNTGKSAYFYLKSHRQYECLFFVDGDSNKWGKEIEGLQVRPPEALKHIEKAKVIIASIFWKEIMEEIKEIDGLEITIYNPSLKERRDASKLAITEELSKRTIDLGAFLINQKEIFCRELTFIPGGSMVLDYAFLKALAQKYHCKNYLEIGTYIGESINVMTDCCEILYSITAAIGETDSAFRWCRRMNVPDYSGRLADSEKIVHFYADSKKFDYSQIEDSIDLYFIDGDHRYEGVYADTKNVFKVKKENAIVVWHDFRVDSLQFREEVVMAVKDALGDQFRNVYVTNNNLCGVYLPDAYIRDFEMKELKYEENAQLYTYDVVIKNCQVK